MDDELKPPSVLQTGISEGVCAETTSGWLWYCDVHDTHGNADSQDEATIVSDAHRTYFLDLSDQEDEPCAIEIWMRTPHERAYPDVTRWSISGRANSRAYRGAYYGRRSQPSGDDPGQYSTRCVRRASPPSPTARAH